MNQYPLPNNPGTNFGLQNNYFADRFPKADRDNYDVKVNYNPTSAQQWYVKYSTMDATVADLYYLPFDNAGGGDTNVYLGNIGSTWTLTPTTILDFTTGFNIMKHASQGPDFGTNYGLEEFGIPGSNSAGVTGPGSENLDFYSGMPAFETGFSTLGNNATWTPVTRDERNFTFSANLTKVAGRHEVRSGFDYVRLRLDHWQPEIANPRGTFTTGGGLTGTTGYNGLAWNSGASLMLGLMSGWSKSVQFEEMPCARTSSACTSRTVGR